MLALALSGLAALTFGSVLNLPGPALLLGASSGAALAGLYATAPHYYPPQLRATGTGVALGIGRIGAILSPIATGLLVDRGWTATRLYLLASPTFVLAGIALLRLRLPRIATSAASSDQARST